MAPAMVALVNAGFVDVLFAGNALATHDIEAALYGTSLGNWTWQPLVPWLKLSNTNPPACSGTFYCVLDILVLASMNVLRGNKATKPHRNKSLKRSS